MLKRFLLIVTGAVLATRIEKGRSPPRTALAEIETHLAIPVSRTARLGYRSEGRRPPR
jgi:hypothetical protein